MKTLRIAMVTLILIGATGCDALKRATSSPPGPQEFIGICSDWASALGVVEYCLQSARARWVEAEMDEIVRQILVIASERFTARKVGSLSLSGTRLFIEDSAYERGGDYKKNPNSAHIVTSSNLFDYLYWLFGL